MAPNPRYYDMSDSEPENNGVINDNTYNIYDDLE